MDRALITELEKLIGKDAVVSDTTRLLSYESDALAMYSAPAELVLIPKDTQETAGCMKVLARYGIPIVPRGAGTGLTGGALPIAGGAVIATSRMRQVFEVNPVDGFARVGAGLINVALTHACKSHNMFYAPDPSSQRACTIGGNVANNSGGPHGFKYGSTTQHILGLVVVTPDGDIIDMSAAGVDPVGLDLVGLFVGSEGTFGLATEVTVKLEPCPEVVETLLAVYTGEDGLNQACDAVSEIIALGLEPSAIEILDSLTIEAVEDSLYSAGYPRDASAVLLLEVEGTATEVRGTCDDIEALVKRFGAVEFRRAQDEVERAKLWEGRKGAFGAMGRIAPDLYVADAVVPRTKLREMVRATVAIAEKYNLKLATVFHAGDGNLHPNICYDRRNKEEAARVVKAGAEILKACVAAGGSLTGEHGIGIEKLDEIGLLFTDDDLEAMGRVRRAWDPTLRMNPGKAIPLRACGELGDSPRGDEESS